MEKGSLCYEEEDVDYYLYDDNNDEFKNASRGSIKSYDDDDTMMMEEKLLEPDDDEDPVKEVAKAMKLMGDGFVRMEQMKMQMVKEMETRRMQMEINRTKLILDSQERILELIAGAISKKNKKKKKNKNNKENGEERN